MKRISWIHTNKRGCCLRSDMKDYINPRYCNSVSLWCAQFCEWVMRVFGEGFARTVLILALQLHDLLRSTPSADLYDEEIVSAFQAPKTSIGDIEHFSDTLDSDNSLEAIKGVYTPCYVLVCLLLLYI